jgi:hypothetical protein
MSVMYTWSVNGSEVQTGSNHTLSGSFFDKGEVVLLSVVADDGNDMSVASTGTLTVSNSLPSAPGISLFPSAPIEGVDDLLCSIDTSSGDADSDSVSYSFAWTVDTVVFTSSTDTATTSTISAFDTISGEDWACTVTPNDGDADGSSSNVSVFIEGGCDSFSEVDYNGSCYYLDGSGGSCDSGYVLAPQSVLATISSSFIGKTYKNQVSGNCCIWHANQSSERQDYGMSAECNSSGPFTVGPVLGGAGCNDALNLGSTQLTLCVSN